MATVINDPVFGKITYQHRWYKTEDIVLFGKRWNITIAAQAYTGQSILQIQRDCYKGYPASEELRKDCPGTDKLYQY